ncbi:unnamed protein product [Linum tenue]|uniref:WAT1-related protein n=1 Tax=Linum tenue TaxID=586396 RepID=A0AAV0NAN9_9ROSI|nr:unnamed protein product [Linum tenue]
MAGGGRFVYGDLLPFSAMVSMECMNVGLNTLFKAATTAGMSYYVYVVYAYAIAALVLLPAPFFSHRSTALPPLSFSVLWKIGLLGVIVGSSSIVGSAGISYSSPTLASAIANLTPAFTFILAVMFRMEKVVLRRRSHQAKVLGTIVSIAGAFVVTLYKGAPMFIAAASSSSSLAQPYQSLESSPAQYWVLGGIFLTLFFRNIAVTITATIVALYTEGTCASAWILRPNVALASVLCTGLLGSCLKSVVRAWVVRKKGPVFVVMFKPFSVVIAVAMGAMFLGDTLYVGSVIGAVVLSIGFYAVMWGKAHEDDFCSQQQDTQSTEKAPLLQTSRRNAQV